MTLVLSVLEQTISDDFGIELQGESYARSKEHSSLVIDRKRQIFFWNSTGIVGDIYVYLTKVRKWSHETAKDFLKQNNFTATFITSIANKGEVTVYPKLVEVFHENLMEGDKSYFHNRMIDDETIKRFQLGFYNGYYTIPIFIDGALRQIQLRRDSPKLITNFYTDVGVFLFNSDVMKFTNKIVLTEGIIGAILLMKHGIPAVSMNVGAEGFQPSWIKHFVNQKEIVIVYDRDKAGDNGAIHSAKILGVDRCKIYNLFDYETEKYGIDDALLDGVTVEELMYNAEHKFKFAYEMEDKKVKRDYKRY